MARFFRNVLIAVALVAAAIGAVAAWVLDDPNRFKPRLEALIREQTGVPVSIAGDLDWRLWPPISIMAEDLSADHQGLTWQVGRLSLDLDAFAAVRDPAQWRIEALMLNDAVLRQEGSVVTVREARLNDLVPNRPAPLTAELSYAGGGREPVPVRLNGHVLIDPETLNVSLHETRIITPEGEGTCSAEARPVADPAPAPAPAAQDLIPVALFRSYSWTGECRLDWVQVDHRRFEHVAVNFTNEAGDSAVTARAPRFFGGLAVADLVIDARKSPVRWTLTPTLTDVNSAELMAWLNQRLNWATDLAYGGTLTFEGNSAEELMASLSGETHFDGGDGRIDIARIRSQLVSLARMFNEEERIRRWPEIWDYEHFVGTWRIDRQHHQIDAVLDNLSVSGGGDVRPDTGEMDMLFTLVFGKDPALPVFDLHPLLYDLPIPVRCRGALEDPACRVDQQVAERLVAAALSGENPELRSRLEEKIDEEVPEEYRDAARSLLDALGTSLKRRSREQ